MDDSCRIDSSALDHLVAIGGAAFTVRMIDLFLEGGSKRMEEAWEREKAGDWTGVQKAVHAMRSSAGNFGARRLFDLAGEIEHLAMLGQTSALPGLLHTLEEILNQVQNQLRQERERLRL
ncbi:MAG TPA: Hpt domain-containing protein [bacterium]|nr:Hpt domain-containing protein [Candidatus Omnitrophota bacterium]HOL93188.1 Hpt domain-containing protein [bacterium]HPP00197.1 Hpt domain-containing protein [bacterium]HXK93384.1 Hpt domain-containing protein [bacterium]